MARTYARSGGGGGERELALENVKPTDSPIYRPPSEFAVRAFRKTFAALGIAERDERERGNRTETARRRGVFRFLCTRARQPASERTNERSDAAFLPSFSLYLARGALRWRVAESADAREKDARGKQREGEEEGRSEEDRAGAQPAFGRSRSRNEFLLTHLRERRVL